jgi:hypothetical protein
MGSLKSAEAFDKGVRSMTRGKFLVVATVLLPFFAVYLLAVNIPSHVGVTKANFDRIEIGMTFDEVESILGPPEGPTTNISGQFYDTWIGDEGVAFVYCRPDSRVSNKRWAGRTYFQILTRWINSFQS